MDFCFPIYVLELWQVGSRLTRRKYRNTTDLSHSRQERRTTHRRQTGRAAKGESAGAWTLVEILPYPAAHQLINSRKPTSFWRTIPTSTAICCSSTPRASSSTCPNLPGLNLVPNWTADFKLISCNGVRYLLALHAGVRASCHTVREYGDYRCRSRTWWWNISTE